jgi:hypothetical protein
MKGPRNRSVLTQSTGLKIERIEKGMVFTAVEHLPRTQKIAQTTNLSDWK